MLKSFTQLRNRALAKKNPFARRANYLARMRRPRRRTFRRKLYRGARGVGSKTAGSTMRFQGQNMGLRRRLEEVLGTLALGAAAGALAYRAVTRPGGVVDRVKSERIRKEKLKMAIKNTEIRLKDLKDKLNKTSTFKAAVDKNFANRRLEESHKNISPGRRAQLMKTSGEVTHQKLYGNKHPYFGPKSRQQQRIIDKINARLNKEEAGPVSVGGEAVPSITDSTTNHAAQLKKKSNMLRRKKSQ